VPLPVGGLVLSVTAFGKRRERAPRASFGVIFH
jgi:hypothetical protein